MGKWDTAIISVCCGAADILTDLGGSKMKCFEMCCIGVKSAKQSPEPASSRDHFDLKS